MPTVLSRASFVSSLFVTSGNVYVRATHGTDPTYPEVKLAENVTVSGGRVVWNSNDTHQTAGLVLDNFPTFDGSEGYIEATYTPNADVLPGGSDQLSYIPLICVHTSGNRVLMFALYKSAGALRWDLYTRKIDGSFSAHDSAAGTFTAGQTYTFKMAWKCGTLSAGASVASDGYVLGTRTAR
jgi:hypothetical protein